MSASVRIVWNPDWPEEVLSAPQAVDVLEEAAHAGLEAIEAAVPVHTGSYKQHFDLTLHVEKDGHHALIVTGEPRWHIIEHGSVNNQPYNPISRGVEATGMRFVRT